MSEIGDPGDKIPSLSLVFGSYIFPKEILTLPGVFVYYLGVTKNAGVCPFVPNEQVFSFFFSHFCLERVLKYRNHYIRKIFLIMQYLQALNKKGRKRKFRLACLERP